MGIVGALGYGGMANAAGAETLSAMMAGVSALGLALGCVLGFAADFRALLAEGGDTGTAAVIAGWRESRCVNCGKSGKDFSRPLGCGGEVDVDCEWIAADSA